MAFTCSMYTNINAQLLCTIAYVVINIRTIFNHEIVLEKTLLAMWGRYDGNYANLEIADELIFESLQG